MLSGTVWNRKYTNTNKRRKIFNPKKRWFQWKGLCIWVQYIRGKPLWKICFLAELKLGERGGGLKVLTWNLYKNVLCYFLAKTEVPIKCLLTYHLKSQDRPTGHWNGFTGKISLKLWFVIGIIIMIKMSVTQHADGVRLLLQFGTDTLSHPPTYLLPQETLSQSFCNPHPPARVQLNFKKSSMHVSCIMV